MQPTHAAVQVFAAPSPPRESNSASIAAWILLALACIGACIPGLGFAVWIIIVPILLITLILGIIAISKGSTWNGVWIILASLIAVPGFVLLAPFVSTALAIGAAQDSPNTSVSTPAIPDTVIQQPDAANVITTLPQAATQTPEATGIVVTSVDLGSAVGADNAITAPTTSFGPMDTIHASVATDGSGGMLGAKWTYQDGQVVDTQDKEVASGLQVTDFSISKPDGWPLGGYRLEVSQAGRLVARRDLEVTYPTLSSEQDSDRQDQHPEQAPVTNVEPSLMNAAPSAPAQSTAPTRNIEDLNANICSKPAMGPLIRAMTQSRLNSADLALQLFFTADGSVTDVNIARSSSNRDLDRAALSWARGLKLCPGKAGAGLLPLKFSLNG